MRFGKGGVDDAEDAEVILHEHGHAIHFSQGFALRADEAGAISEGFGDYWAATSAKSSRRRPTRPCIADWDSVLVHGRCRTACAASTRTCTTRSDLNGEVHHDGQIWSRALWDIRTALGHVKADTIILEAQFGFPGHDDDAARAGHRPPRRSRCTASGAATPSPGVRATGDPLGEPQCEKVRGREIRPAHRPRDLEREAAARRGEGTPFPSSWLTRSTAIS